MVAATAETIMTRTRPKRSDKALAGTIASASNAVVADTVSAETAGDTEYSADSTGSKPCV